MSSDPPAEVFKALIVEQAIRWGYDRTLDADALTTYVRDRIGDSNLRADVSTVWAFAEDYFGRRNARADQ